MKQVRVKICGITTMKQAIAISALNVDALGFVLYKKSPRYIEPEKIRAIINILPPLVKTVGVFVNETVADLTDKMSQSRLDLAQLSGDESPDYCQQLSENGISWIRSFRIRDAADLDQIGLFQGNYILMDARSDTAFGGTGNSFDWQLIDLLPNHCEIILAGGINLENVEKAIKSVRPYGIDISSGVEKAPGVKSIEMVKALLRQIKILEAQV